MALITKELHDLALNLSYRTMILQDNVMKRETIQLIPDYDESSLKSIETSYIVENSNFKAQVLTSFSKGTDEGFLIFLHEFDSSKAKLF